MNQSAASIFQRLFCRAIHLLRIGSALRKFFLVLRGAKIGQGTRIPRCAINWPHQARIGSNCVLEDGIVLTFADSWKPGPSISLGNRVFMGRNCELNICGSIAIGDDALIASGCKFIDHDHGIEMGSPINSQPGRVVSICLEDDVWLGVNVVVLKGVVIGRGAVVGAGAVVTKSIPPYEIWAGIPAKKIGERNKLEK